MISNQCDVTVVFTPLHFQMKPVCQKLLLTICQLLQNNIIMYEHRSNGRMMLENIHRQTRITFISQFSFFFNSTYPLSFSCLFLCCLADADTLFFLSFIFVCHSQVSKVALGSDEEKASFAQIHSLVITCDTPKAQPYYPQPDPRDLSMFSPECCICPCSVH